MMKILLLLAFMAVACEAWHRGTPNASANAPRWSILFEPMRDPRPVYWDRKAYRSASWRLGANGTPSVHPLAFLFGRIHGRAGSHWPRPDNIAAVYSRTDDPSRCGQVRRYGAGSRHGFRLPGRSTGAFGSKVCTVEIIPPLAEAAAKVLRELGYDNVSVKVGDGYLGWPECGPFDAIIVTAALDHVPPPLIEQLKVGGRLVMPLGPAHAPQQLTVVEKIAPSETRMRSITLVGFVPFTRSQD